MKPLYGFCFMAPFPVLGQAARYQNPNLPAEQRPADLISRMTVEEKVLQMQNSAPAITPRRTGLQLVE